MNSPDNWDSPRNILVLLAHPDDPGFFCGATIARWIKAGHCVKYCLLTYGEKGTKDRNISNEDICRIRQSEQYAAASVLGVENVRFLDYPDGYLIPDLGLRRDITRVIRQERPDILVTCDPQNLYIRDTRLNHPDHRAVGQATLDAVFPAARDHLFFVDLWRKEKLEPHVVNEVWISLPQKPNVVLDVSEFWEIKIQALCEHKSQIGDKKKFEKRMRKRFVEAGENAPPRYEEKFLRLILN